MTATCVVYLHGSVYNFWLSPRKFKQTSKSGTLQNRFPPTPLSSQFSQETFAPWWAGDWARKACCLQNEANWLSVMVLPSIHEDLCLQSWWGNQEQFHALKLEGPQSASNRVSAPCNETWNIRNYSWKDSSLCQSNQALWATDVFWWTGCRTSFFNFPRVGLSSESYWNILNLRNAMQVKGWTLPQFCCLGLVLSFNCLWWAL